MDGMSPNTERDILLASISACQTILAYALLYQSLDEYLTLRESMDPLMLRLRNALQPYFEDLKLQQDLLKSMGQDYPYLN
jgi:hypothetical protein